MTGIQQQKLASLAKRGKPDASVAIRIARAAGVDINSLLAGAWPASLCPRCGEHGSQRSNAVGATTITIDTEHPIAKSSPDHTHPFGTKQDNSRNGAFNKKLYSLYNRPMSVMDLGCSGGGFVKDCLDDGHMAIGLEGSDYSRNAGRAEWSTIPESLFTCDISKPFSVIGDGMPAMFDTVTAWEVLEHLKEDELEVLSSNVRAHLHPQGLWIASVATCPDFQNGVHLHQTVHPREWWEAWFLTNGWCVDQRLISFFGRDWVRVNPRVNPGNGFNTVLRRSSRW